MENILNTILKDTYTIAELKHKLNILKSYLLQNFFGAQAQKEWAAQDLVWLKSLSPAFFQSFNKDNVYNFFTEAEKQIAQIKILTIYLTFEADDQTLTQIGQFGRKTFNSLLLLDIKYDPNLIAGAALVWNGIYKDYSLRSTIQQKKSLILDSFKKFLR